MVIQVWNDMNPKSFLSFIILEALRSWGVSTSIPYLTSMQLFLMSFCEFLYLKLLKPWPIDLWTCPLFPPFSSVLFNEVRYVHTPAELLHVESAAKQNSDIVVGHIPVLGLPGTISIFSIVHCLGWNEAILYISCFVFLSG